MIKNWMISVAIVGAAMSPASATAPDRPAGEPETTSSAWAALAKADISSVYDEVSVIHPGIRNPEDPGFQQRLNTAYRSALAEGSRARSFADWRAAMNGFFLSFRDGHTTWRPTVAPTIARWPGFLIDGRATGWFVRRPAGSTSSGAPSDGAKLLSCDGVPATELLARRLDLREADWSKEPERLRQGFRLMIDYHLEGPAPLQQCTFDDKGQVDQLTLKWRTVNFGLLSQKLAPFLREDSRPIERRQVASGGEWISVGDLGDEHALDEFTTALDNDKIRLRQAKFIVFDLRGNGGGNSAWGFVLSTIIWGDEAVNTMLANRGIERSGTFWRASPKAIAMLETAIAAGNVSPAAIKRRAMLDAMSRKPDGDATLFADPGNRASPKRQKMMRVSPAYHGAVYVLTDAGCFSSCVLFVDMLKQMGAIQIGETTGQNEEYGEVVAPFTLPSGLGRYQIPVAIIRQPKAMLRSEPTIPWKGSMSDSSGIEQWIIALAGANRSTGPG